MTSSIEIQTLMAYIDGELEAQECVEVERALEQQPELRQRYQRLIQLDELLNSALSPALKTELPALEYIENDRHSGFSSAVTWLSSWWPKIAMVPLWQAGIATLLLAVGVVIGGGYERQTQQQGLVVQQQLLQQAIDRALETRLSGDSLSWGSEQGSITPVRTYKTQQGQFCREFIYRGGKASDVGVKRGVACRDQQGWQLKANYYL